MINKDAETHLLITQANGWTNRFDLAANISYLAGSSDNCRIFLSGDNVNPIHCRLWLDECCHLKVQDWNTDGKTRLNGEPIEEADLNEGDSLEIGDYRIVVATAATPATTGDFRQTTVTAKDSEARPNEIASAEQLDEFEPQSMAVNETPFVYELDLDADDKAGDCQAAPVDLANGQPRATGFDTLGAVDDEVEWLRMEVEQLRIEMAERDAFNEQQNHSSSKTQSEFEEDSDNLKLVNRLEELLQELQTSDERIRGLEDLLQASDEATRAEQEEREHLESWVEEIEQRVTQREAEAAAELTRVTNQLKEARSRNKLADSQLEQALESNGNAFSDSSNHFIKKLRGQMNDLRHRLDVVEKENEELRNADRKQAAESAGAKIQELEQKLLQQQVEFSRERADIARKRVQLERLKDELEKTNVSNHKMDDATSRVMAMRQHLRDIHEEEKLEREERKQRSLGGRIARLLNRVGN